MSDTKKTLMDREYTRRQFMKISGRSLAGLTLSASMLSLFGCSQQQVDSGAVATWALPQGLLVSMRICAPAASASRSTARGPTTVCAPLTSAVSRSSAA